jgi:hypothetical protein
MSPETARLGCRASGVEAGMREKELAIVTKTYDLVKWSCQHTSKFPRNHRFVLGERIERRLYDLLETLVQARYTRDRQALLRQANLGVEVLRFQMRLAHDLHCLRTNSYGFATQALQEIGSMVGGWLKAGESKG